MLKEMLDFWSKFDFIQKIFKKEEATGKVAHDRLRLVLIHDRASFAPQLMEALREDLIKVISRYMEIDSDHMEMGFDRKDGAMALAASIPIIRIKKTIKVASLTAPEPEDIGPAPDLQESVSPAVSPAPSRPPKPKTKAVRHPKPVPAKRRRPRKK